MNKVKEKLQSNAYSFLKNNPDLKKTIYLTLSGSYAYGTNVENSDIDLRGVLIEQPRYLYGLHHFEQFEDRETDTVIYGLKKFVSLCVNANPSTLELLGTREDCIVKMTPEGKMLRDHAGWFLSKRVIQSFGNYAAAQLRRLSNALCHDHYLPVEQEKHLAELFQGQIDHFNDTYAFLGDGMRIYLSDDENPQLFFDLELHRYPVRDFVGIYSEMNNIIKTYGKMNHRNRKKDEVHLYKHAMHLIRLLMAGEDILRGNGLITEREAEHELLLDIRKGNYSFEEVLKMAEVLQLRFNEAAQKTSLPAQPDMDKIEALMQEVYAL